MNLFAGFLSARGVLALCCLCAALTVAGCSVEVGDDAGDSNFGALDDSDRDGLNDTLEKEIGTDPDNPDTDGDRLPDGWEYRNETPDGAALPDADPLQKDIYVQVNYAQDVEPLTATERENVEEMWATMNTSNPDGESGVDIHIDDDEPHGGAVNVSGRLTELTGDYNDERYAEFVPPARECVYHGVLYQKTDNDAVDGAGIGSIPGYSAIVAGQQSDGFSRERQRGKYNVRERGLTHELLHNVAGEIGEDGSSHTETGYLAHDYDDIEDQAWNDRYNRLSEPVAEQFSTEGFADSPGDTAEVCT